MMKDEEYEVKTLISELVCKGAPGYDGFSAELIKNVSEVSVIKPISKSGHKTDVANYRPIG